MKYFRPLLTIIFCICNLLLFAQITSCGTDEVHRHLLQTNPAYKNVIELQYNKWEQYNLEKAARGASNLLGENGIYELSVVFHIIHTGEEIGHFHNPADSIVINKINKINQILDGTYPLSYPGSDRITIPIKLKLAQRTPDCQPTNGIIRVNGSGIPGYAQYGIAYPGSSTSQGAPEIQVKALSIWPNSNYLNIWVVIKGGQFAYLPSSPLNSLDGVVVISNEANPLDEYVLAHEIGHSLGLLHTFQGAGEDPETVICPPNSNCLTQGDGVCDTEPHPFIGCSNEPTNPCTNNPYTEVKHNIMNYGCVDRFTEGQSERMQHCLLLYRSKLITSLGGSLPLAPPSISPPISAVCNPTGPSGNLNYTNGVTKVKLADLLCMNSGYAGDDFQSYIDHTILPATDCILQPVHIAHLFKNQTYSIEVGAYDIDPHNVRGWIDFNNNEQFESSELIISSDGTAGYQNHMANFMVPSNAIDNGISVRMRIMADPAYYPAPTPCSFLFSGQTEDFIVSITSPLALTYLHLQSQWQNKNAQLSWTTEGEINTKNFDIEKSTDGISFNKIASTIAMNTPGRHQYHYTDNNAAAEKKTLYYRIKQRDIDEQFTYSNTVALSVNGTNTKATLYPNPVKDILNIVFEETRTGKTAYNITDLSGRTIMQGSIVPSGNLLTLPVQDLKAGYYIIKTTYNQHSLIHSFIKQ